MMMKKLLVRPLSSTTRSSLCQGHQNNFSRRKDRLILSNHNSISTSGLCSTTSPWTHMSDGRRLTHKNPGLVRIRRPAFEFYSASFSSASTIENHNSDSDDVTSKETTATTKVKVSDSEYLKYEESTKRLLKLPLTSFWMETWDDAETLIRWWLSNGGGQEDHTSSSNPKIDPVLELLERMLHEIQAATDNNSIVEFELSEDIFPRAVNVLRRPQLQHVSRLQNILVGFLKLPRNSSSVSAVKQRHVVQLLGLWYRTNVPDHKAYHLFLDYKEWAQQNNQIVTLPIYQSTLEVLSKHGQYQQANEIMTELWEQYQKQDTDDDDSLSSVNQQSESLLGPDRSCFHAMILACRKDTSKAVLADQWFERMKQQPRTSTSSPSLTTYKHILNIWRQSPDPESTDRCHALLLELLEHPELKVSDPFFLNLVLDKFAQEGHFDRAEDLLKDWMSACGSQVAMAPDAISLNTVLKSYLVAAADAPEKYGVAARRADGLLQQWLEWNQTGQISSSPNGRSFSTVLGLYCKDKNAEEESVLRALQILSIMEDLYDETKTRGMRPDRIVYNSLLVSLGNLENYESAQAADMLLKRMKSKFPRMPTLLEYNLVLKAWSKSGHKSAGRHALAIIKSMVEDKITPDIVSYNTVLAAVARSGDSLGAESILQDMINNPHLPNPTKRSFTSVISSWAEQGQPGKALKLLDLMDQLNEEPNTFIYNCVLQGFVRSRDRKSTERAFALFDSMRERGLVNHVSYNTMIHLLAFDKSKSNDAVERAEQLLDEMERSLRITPNEVTYNTLLKTILFQHQTPDRESRIGKLRSRMTEMGIEVAYPYRKENWTDRPSQQKNTHTPSKKNVS